MALRVSCCSGLSGKDALVHAVSLVRVALVFSYQYGGVTGF